jgi:hypothetical protein
VRLRVNLPLREILCGELGVAPDYLETRIQTLFLDGHPVDRLEDRVPDGAVLALSGALPGLVGATLRRAGRYASLRAGISHADGTGGSAEPVWGGITLKLFNLVLEELAPVLLARGLRLRAVDLALLWEEILSPSPGPLFSATLDGRDLLPERLAHLLETRANAEVLLKVVDPPEGPAASP